MNQEQRLGTMPDIVQVSMITGVTVDNVKVSHNQSNGPGDMA